MNKSSAVFLLAVILLNGMAGAQNSPSKRTPPSMPTPPALQPSAPTEPSAPAGVPPDNAAPAACKYYFRIKINVAPQKGPKPISPGALDKGKAV